ncbi:MAG: response regulator [Bdellovibrionota bacterium]
MRGNFSFMESSIDTREWPSDSSEAEAPKPIRLDGLTILLVDDSFDNQLLFQRVLAGAGAKVEIANNGVEAIAHQAGKAYDLIIMDVRMPIMDGYEATRRIRASGYTKPIIALTAHATPGEEERCRTAGCSHFELKPIGRQLLLGVIATAAKR